MFLGTCLGCGRATFSWDEFNEHASECERLRRRGTVAEKWHGKLTGYTRGCRCQSCRGAKAQYERRDRQKNPEKHRARDRARRARQRQRQWLSPG